MKNLKEKLAEVIITKPDTIQFTKDRKFEEAWILSINQVRPLEKEINDYLQKNKFELIIVEYIWNSSDNNNRIVLTLFLDKKCQLQSPKLFVEISLDLFYSYQGFEFFIESINNKIIGKNYLFNRSIDSVNIGVFNYWFSVGPVDLWNNGDVYDLATIKSKLKARPEVEKSKLNYQGLFFRFNIKGSFDGPYYGIKTPCCKKVGNIWTIDYKKVDYWMKLMSGL